MERDAFIQNASDTQPAVVHCMVTCHIPGGRYIAAMGIVHTEDGSFHQTRIADIEAGLYIITFQSISSCTSGNNTMEFRYHFYPLSARMNRTVLTCGVVQTSPHNQAACWGQSYLIINYTSATVSPPTVTTATSMSLPNTVCPTTACINPTPTFSLSITAFETIPTMSQTISQPTVTTYITPVTPVTGTGGNGGSKPSVADSQDQHGPAEVYTPPTVLAVALAVAISVAIIEGVIIALRYRRNNQVKPLCAQNDSTAVIPNKATQNTTKSSCAPEEGDKINENKL